MADNILFPPIVDTYQPIFIQGEDCKIYFAFSQFNTKDDVNNKILVSIVNPNTNKSILKDSYIYEMGAFMIDKNDNSVTIPHTELQEGELPLNQYFKVQLRFIDSSVVASKDDDLYNLPADKMSEWSNITLIRNIAVPTLKILNFSTIEGETISIDRLSQIEGQLTFASTIEQDKLNTYRIQIYSENQSILWEDSGTQYTDAYNHFVYRIKTFLAIDTKYLAKITYTTVAGYQETREHIFLSGEDYPSNNKAILEVNPDSEQGIMHLKMTLSSTGADLREKKGTLYILRSSYKDGFLKNDAIHMRNIKYMLNAIPYYFDDITVESGVFYKYTIQFVEKGQFTSSQFLAISEPVMLELDDLYLTDGSAQLKIKFNPSVSSMRYVVVESTTNTLGGKYPIVRRNGNTNYRQFNIGGLISYLADSAEETGKSSADFSSKSDNSEKSFMAHLEDENNIRKEFTNASFLTREEAFGLALSNYDRYNEANRITPYNDFIFEKVFRDKVATFLGNGAIKLFRSAAEGNILVVLTNISFTPNTQLGNMIYSFSATATEIAEDNIDNYFKYGILKESDPTETVSLYVLPVGNTVPALANGIVYVNKDKLTDKTELVLKEITREK